MRRAIRLGAGLAASALCGCGILSGTRFCEPRACCQSAGSAPVQMLPTSYSGGALPPGAYVVPGSMRTVPCTNCGGGAGSLSEGPSLPGGSSGEPSRVLPRPRPIDGKVDEGPFATPKSEDSKTSLVKPIPPVKSN